MAFILSIQLIPINGKKKGKWEHEEFIFFCLRYRIRGRRKKKEGRKGREERRGKSIYSFTLQISFVAELGQAKVKSQELNLGFPCEWQELSYLTPPASPSRTYTLAGSWIRSQSLPIKPSTLKMVQAYPKHPLNCFTSLYTGHQLT